MLGILFLNMGGPDSLDTVRPFLFNLFSDREIIRLSPAILQRPIAWLIAWRRAPKSRMAYSKIGGRSPLAGITASQAKAVQHRLERQLGKKILCFTGMRYWHPRTPDVLKKMKAEGVTRVLGFSLYPHYSKATGGSSIREFERCCRAAGLEYSVVESFPDDPGYVASLAETVRQGLSESEKLLSGAARESRGNSPVMVYSAHSLPKQMITDGDPYVEHLHRTIHALEGLTGIKGTLCFQSRSGPVEWLEPATDTFLLDMAERGNPVILILPISFVSDHVETLYEIDILYKGMLRQHGTKLVRTPSLNNHPAFIKALSDIAHKAVEDTGWLR